MYLNRLRNAIYKYQDLRNCHNVRLVRDTKNLITMFRINQSVTGFPLKIFSSKKFLMGSRHSNGNKTGRESTPFFASPTRQMCRLCKSYNYENSFYSNLKKYYFSFFASRLICRVCLIFHTFYSNLTR